MQLLGSLMAVKNNYSLADIKKKGGRGVIRAKLIKVHPEH